MFDRNIDPTLREDDSVMSKMIKSKFFIVSNDITKSNTGIIIENEGDLKAPNVIPFMSGDIQKRGFSHLRRGVKPILRYDRKKGRLPKDIEVVRGCWLISNRLKELLDETDHSAFEFLECDLLQQDLMPEGRFWLCDVTRLIDAIDEGKSTLTKHHYEDRNRVMFTIPTLGKLVLDQKHIKTNRIFRLEFSERTVICDKDFRMLAKEKKIQGFSFTPAFVIDQE